MPARPPWPLSISTRLFLAVWSTLALVVVAMSVAAGWSFNQGFIGYLNEQAVARLDSVLPETAAAYARHGNWNFMRDDVEEWLRLFRPSPGAAEQAYLAPPTKRLPPVSDLTGAVLRLSLLDAQRQVIHGYRDRAPHTIERPIVVDGSTVGWITLAPFQSVSEAGHQRFQREQLRSAVLIGMAAIALAAAVAWWLSRVVLRPIRQVTRAAHALARGDYATRIPPGPHDEVGRLAADFNHLARTLQNNEQQRRNFMADISHELRSPLGILHGELEAVEDGVRPLSLETIQSLQFEVHHLNKLVNDLYDLSLADVGQLAFHKTDVDLAHLLEQTARGFRQRMQERRLQLELALPGQPVMLHADPRRLQQLLGNLLENSCRYTDGGGTIRLALRLDAHDSHREAVLDCLDSAPAVAPERLPHLFERFYRADDSRNRASGGAGLGLAICHSIALAHAGSLQAQASPLGGVWIRLRLPMREEARRHG